MLWIRLAGCEYGLSIFVLSSSLVSVSGYLWGKYLLHFDQAHVHHSLTQAAFILTYGQLLLIFDRRLVFLSAILWFASRKPFGPLVVG